MNPAVFLFDGEVRRLCSTGSVQIRMEARYAADLPLNVPIMAHHNNGSVRVRISEVRDEAGERDVPVFLELEKP